jgi:CspA family cold shock protein
MAKGRVKWFDPRKGYGFIVNQDGQDVFVHYTGIDQEGFRCLKNNQTVEFEQVQSPKGLQGWKVRVLREASGREVLSERQDPEES